jgi:hypothetical protein
VRNVRPHGVYLDRHENSGEDTFVEFVGLVEFVEFVGFVGFVGFVEFVGFVGFVGLVEFEAKGRSWSTVRSPWSGKLTKVHPWSGDLEREGGRGPWPLGAWPMAARRSLLPSSWGVATCG